MVIVIPNKWYIFVHQQKQNNKMKNAINIGLVAAGLLIILTISSVFVVNVIKMGITW